jgi:hypothetical protein
MGKVPQWLTVQIHPDLPTMVMMIWPERELRHFGTISQCLIRVKVIHLHCNDSTDFWHGLSDFVMLDSFPPF